MKWQGLITLVVFALLTIFVGAALFMVTWNLAMPKLLVSAQKGYVAGDFTNLGYLDAVYTMILLGVAFVSFGVYTGGVAVANSLLDGTGSLFGGKSKK